MCKTRLDTKIHPRPSAEDAKFELSGESSSAQPQKQDSGNPEDVERHSRRRSNGATRGCEDGAAGGCEIRGNPEFHRTAWPWEKGFGATRRLIPRQAKSESSRGAPETELKARPEGGKSGQPGDSP
jgi:hypothetical protein